MKKLGIIGAGAWGRCLATVLENNFEEIYLWSHDEEKANILNNTLKKIMVTSDIQTVITHSDIVLNALPTHAIRSVYSSLKLKSTQIVISASKGIDVKTHQFPSHLFKELFPQNPFFVFSGASFSHDLLKEGITHVNLAGEDKNMAEDLCRILQTSFLLPKFLPDTIGVEWSGIFKNVIAIGIGICDGLELGENARAAAFQKGCSELIQFGIKLGAKQETFSESCGIGDVFLSSTSPKGRNYSLGKNIGVGKSLEDALATSVGISEGYASLSSLPFIFQNLEKAFPFTFSLYQILYKNKKVTDVFMEMLRSY